MLDFSRVDFAFRLLAFFDLASCVNYFSLPPAPLSSLTLSCALLISPGSHCFEASKTAHKLCIHLGFEIAMFPLFLISPFLTLVGLEPTTFGLENQCSLQLSYENCIVLSLFVLGCISNTLTPHSITESFKSGLTRILSRSIGSDHNVTSFSPKSHDYYNRFLGIISNYGDICWSLVISQILNDILTSFCLLSTYQPT